MSSVFSKRLVFVVVLVLAAFSYVRMRDSIRVEAHLSPRELKTIISGIQEWSRPKMFRQINVRREAEGNVAAWVREPGDRWSVTVFTNESGAWKRFAWFLASADNSAVRNWK